MLKRRDPYFCYGIKYTGGMLLQKWPDKTRFKPTLFHIFLPLNAPDWEKVPFATLFWSTCVQYQCFNLLTCDQCKIYEKLNNDPNQVL